MPRLEDFYHDGTEVMFREETENTHKQQGKLKEKIDSRLKKLAQEKWLSPENPFLWNSTSGDLDFDDF